MTEASRRQMFHVTISQDGLLKVILVLCRACFKKVWAH